MSFNYTVTLVDNSHAPGDQSILDQTKAAASEWSSHLSGLGTLDIQVSIGDVGEDEAEGFPDTAVAIGADGNNELYAPGTETELLTGTDPNGSSPDLDIILDPSILADPSGITSLLAHEIGHGLGILSYRDLQTGQLDGDETTWDSLVRINADGTAVFVGSQAEAAYGGPVPVTTIQNGEQYSHLANSTDQAAASDLMNGLFEPYNFSALDVAIIDDLLAVAQAAGGTNAGNSPGAPPVPAPTLSSTLVDGSSGPQVIVGTADVNFIGTQFAAGTGIVLVDLPHGTVTKGGQLDATLANIQGLQLGADPSVVLGLTAGTDLLYGGSGVDQFYGQGGTDYIQGGTGATTVVGGSGNEIFYSGGGIDAMLGGSAANFMAGGTAATDTDYFYGSGGQDYVYGRGGAIALVGAGGAENLSGGTGFNELVGAAQADSHGNTGFNVLNGSSGTDVFYAGIGTNLLYEGSGVDALKGSSGTDIVYGGSGRSFVYGGSGTDVITTGAGNQYVQAGTGRTYFNDVAAHLTAGRFDQIDGFEGGQGTDLYLPTAVQGATRFVSQNGGTAVLTSAGGGTAELFVSNTSVGSVQGHTHFTL